MPPAQLWVGGLFWFMMGSVERGRVESEKIIAEIHEAFGSVTRGAHAISWRECVALDNYLQETNLLEVRQSDADTHWSELVDDQDWDPFPGIGGFSFINLDGFKYYLPPTMIRFLRGDNSEWFPGHLLKSIEEFTEQESQWTHKQIVAIAHFIDYMSRYDLYDEKDEEEGSDWDTWKKAMKRRWHKFI
jgi:hypothetical protein